MNGNLIVPSGDYKNAYALENVIDYVYGSVYACPEDALYSGVEHMNCADDVIHDFRHIQQGKEMMNHHQIIHLVMTIPVKKNAYNILMKISQCVIERLAYEGLQCMMMPHCGSMHDAYNIHAHMVINPIKMDGSRFYATQDNYRMIRNILNDCSRSVKFRVIYK